MPPARASLLCALLAAPAAAQEVALCGEAEGGAPSVVDLVEPWEETAASLAGGAVRLAVLEADQGSRSLLVLTLPPPADAADPPPDPTAPPPPRRCRIVTEGGPGFADIDLGGLDAEEDPEGGTLTLRIPALRFVPESTELQPVTLRLTLGVADDSLAAAAE